MSKYQKVVTKLGKQVVYLLNDFRDVVVKTSPKEEYWKAKKKGGKEYKLHFSTDLACETLLEAEEITEQEYNSY